MNIILYQNITDDRTRKKYPYFGIDSNFAKKRTYATRAQGVKIAQNAYHHPRADIKSTNLELFPTEHNLNIIY